MLPPHRRRGVVSALLARAFAVLHERGQAEVSAEIDDTNAAALTLLGGAFLRAFLPGLLAGLDLLAEADHA